MKTNFFLILTVLLTMATVSRAGETSAKEIEPKTEVELRKPDDSGISHELTADVSYVGKARTHQGDTQVGKVDEISNSVRYVLSKELSQGLLLRVGADWNRFSFGSGGGVPIPDTLQITSLILGVDYEISDEWLLRFEIEPGLYSDFHEITWDDVNCPAVIGASYIVNADLQWFFGISIDPRREYPVLPGVGVRWHFAPQWTLMLLLPDPRIEYELNKSIKLFVGGSVKGGTYRTGSTFGTNNGNPRLDNATISTTEARLGAGAEWKINNAISIEAQAGYMVYRKFDYYNANTSLRSEPAPYGQLAARVSF